MTGWHTKNLGDAMLATESLLQLEELFLSRYDKNGDTSDAALFIRHESEGRLHCEVVAYFSPATRDLAQAAGADPCLRPSADGLSLFAGSEESWRVLFPETCA